MSREDLFRAMVERKQVMVDGRWRIINQIQMEDGSGFSFNVQFADGVWTYVRCPKNDSYVMLRV
jgi:hypothetical protein